MLAVHVIGKYIHDENEYEMKGMRKGQVGSRCTFKKMMGSEAAIER